VSNDAALIEQAYRTRLGRAAIARTDPNAFCEFVLKDDRHPDRHIKQAPVHRTWHKLIDRHDRLILWAHVEGGKRLRVDAPLPTPDGSWRLMGDLCVGDKVVSRDGRACTVTWVSPIVSAMAYRITFDDGTTIEADPEHQWLAKSLDDVNVRSRAAHKAPSKKFAASAGQACACGCGLSVRRGKRFIHNHHGRHERTADGWRVVTTDAMLKAGLLRASGARRKTGEPFDQYIWRMPLPAPVEFPERELPLDPYVLGVWLGDGTRGTGQITFHIDDRRVFDECVRILGGEGRHRPDKRKPYVRTGTVGARGAMRRALRKAGVLEQKSVPAAYLTASRAQRLSLLQGLLDTDGTVTHRGAAQFANMNEGLTDAVLELARSLGFKAHRTTKRVKNPIDGRDLGLCFTATFMASAPVFRLPRKLALQRKSAPHGRAGYRSVVAIEPVAPTRMRCIQVDSSDSSYLVGHEYLVTHNTSQLTGRLLFEIQKNPDIRAVICGNTAEQGYKTLGACERYIEKDPDLKLVNPNLHPSDPWSRSQFSVKRNMMGRDSTLTAIGVHGNILGARIDFLVLDDILDYENTRTAAAREDLWNWYHSTLVGRLTENAKVVIIGNAWHPEDLLHRLAKSGAWEAYKFPVISDAGVLLWPEQWSLERVQKKKQELINPSEFARQMLCKARDDADAKFREEWINLCLARGTDLDFCFDLKTLFPEGRLPPGFRTITGVDLAVARHSSADKTVIFTALIHPDNSRQPLWIDSGRWTGQDIIVRMRDHRKRYKSVAVVENNAAQDFIVQFASKDIPIIPFTTGTQKAHPEFGIEGIAAEMARGEWIIPNKGGRKHPEITAWIQEMLYYDAANHTGDRLMASWFMREGAMRRKKKIEAGNHRLNRR